ncbi:MAG: 50S ribosomal protein L34 [Candidatus Omnitrophota bacterium]
MKKNLKTPTIIVGKRRHGFLSRMKTSSGRQVLARRRRKGRKKICI